MSDTYHIEETHLERSAAIQMAKRKWFQQFIPFLEPWLPELDSQDKTPILILGDVAQDLYDFLVTLGFLVDCLPSSALLKERTHAEAKHNHYVLVCNFHHEKPPHFDEIQYLMTLAASALRPAGIFALGVNGMSEMEERSILTFLDQNNDQEVVDPGLLPLLPRFYGFVRGVIKQGQNKTEERFWQHPKPSLQEVDFLFAQKQGEAPLLERFDTAFLSVAEDTFSYHGEAQISLYQQHLLKEEETRAELDNRISQLQDQLTYYRDNYELISNSHLWKIGRRLRQFEDKFQWLFEKLQRRKQRFQHSYTKRILRLIKSLLKKKWVRRHPKWVERMQAYRDARLPQEQQISPNLHFELPDFLEDPRINASFDALKAEIAGRSVPATKSNAADQRPE